MATAVALDPLVAARIVQSGDEVTSPPQVWGALLWTVLIYIALNYPNQPGSADKDNYRQFFEQLGPVLPCVTCRQNYQQHLTTAIPLGNGLDSRLALLAWLNSLYNAQDQHAPLTLTAFLNKYLPLSQAQQLGLSGSYQWGGSGSAGNGSRWVWWGLFLALALIALYYYRHSGDKVGRRR